MEDEYESLPESSGMSAHMIAGACAGILEHCVMYPVDSVKTRMQSLYPVPEARYSGITSALSDMVRREGTFRPLRGMSAVVFGAGPAHALYFSCYEYLKRLFSSSKLHSHTNHFGHAAAGCVSTLLHDAIMTPADVVKQRMQMYSSPYASVWECALQTYRTEGIRAFYRSYTTQLTMNVPFHAFHFTTYEAMQNVTNKDRQYSPKSHIVSGAVAGATAAALTTPLDVCKTLLNTQEKTVTRGHAISGLPAAFRTVLKVGGVKALFQGLKARVIYQMPGTAISWTVYEAFKAFLLRQDEVESTGESRRPLPDPSTAPSSGTILTSAQPPSQSILQAPSPQVFAMEHCRVETQRNSFGPFISGRSS
ncbi:unnamed protein product [Cyprideis torosa]|uniref:Uncharacterized protein n=1 Tax=Cyprideis torosa TaxID=163714 RepID=A0A7R8W9J0_9CRUS|nr:unnamed protein product [Cyprideis torosa]CAG0889858.1 unnamed protein product [Cyprideis torosa]